MIRWSLSHHQAVVLAFIMLLLYGVFAYQNVSKERNPDIEVPVMIVNATLEGIAPEDGERLIIRPLERVLRTIEGVKEMTAYAVEGRASVTLEFDAGFNSDKALDDVRAKIDEAQPELPSEVDKPTVQEINFSLFPVINVILSGSMPDRTLLRIARDLKHRIEAIPAVLSVDIAGEKEEALEVLIEPSAVENYGLTTRLMGRIIQGNNQLISAGTLNTDDGRFAIKVPGLIQTHQDLLDLPIKTQGDSVLRLSDIAQVRKTYKDAEGFARVNGKPALVLEVSKRSGTNVIETIAAVKKVVSEAHTHWPDAIEVTYAQDTSDNIQEMLESLENNIILAILFSLIPVLYAVGFRSAGLVALSIPGAFLMGVLFIYLMGYTLNIVVLFGLILSIGMLVDAAIVVCEYADRKMVEGLSPYKAYLVAAEKMKLPVLSSTVTTIMVFVPLLFWPGIMGQFMKYLPITLIATLTSSLFMAFVFIPVLGSLFGKPEHEKDASISAIEDEGDLNQLTGFLAWYVRWLKKVLACPRIFVSGLLAFFIGLFVYYGFFGTGVEFFPDIEPENAMVYVRARGNLSTIQKDMLLKQVEQRVAPMAESIRVMYARSGKLDLKDNRLDDIIGAIQLEFAHWRMRPKVKEILEEVRQRVADLHGIEIDVQKEKPGPPVGKKIELELSSLYPDLLAPATQKLVSFMQQHGGFKDIQDTRPVSAIEWQFHVDRAKAAIFGADIASVGSYIKLATNGLIASSYRPDDSDEEVDVVVRFPKEYRHMDSLRHLRIMTEQGAIPLDNMVSYKPAQQLGALQRADGRRTIEVRADSDQRADILIKDLYAWFTDKKTGWDQRVNIRFKGEDDDKKETSTFLRNAFVMALCAMALLLTAQFNSFYVMGVIMSAIVLSTGGVLIGLLLSAQPFGIVMCGVGIISLAGIVVNNNIIFIDTFRQLLEKGVDVKEALLKTGAQRIRPILLTAGTGVLGLLPMVVGMQIDFLARDIAFGSPSSQWWRQLSTAIAGGLSFATILTLFFTPALLLLGKKWVMPRAEKD